VKFPEKCKTCGEAILPRVINKVNYLYKDNNLMVCHGRCPTCGERYSYIEKSATLYETVFPFKDYGFCKPTKSINNIYTSYVPVVSLVNEYKNKILSIKTKDDVVIGFQGWEDIVIDKKLAKGWYMTYNSPPILDVAVINCMTHCFGAPNVFMSYFPSPILEGKVSIIDNKTIDYFEEKRNVMLDEKRVFYIGIKENIDERRT
jgi:hypothetical protein